MEKNDLKAGFYPAKIFIPSMEDFDFSVFLFIKMHSDVKMYPDNI